jgi:hypothetical protein
VLTIDSPEVPRRRRVQGGVPNSPKPTRYLADLVRQIERLRETALATGNATLAALCDRALDGDLQALTECVRLLRPSSPPPGGAP